MPLDTSIALGVQNPQFQTIDPMTIYNAMQERQMNALRAQALQQTMAQNALTMQNAIEDRRAAAAKAAQERAQAAEFSRILQSGYTPAKNVTMGPGTIQGSTPASFNESPVLNALYAKGNPAMLTAYSNLQEQIAKQREAEAKATGQGLTNVKTQTETKGLDIKNIDAQLAQLNAGLERAASPEDVDMLFDGSADAIRATGKTPESSKATFRQLAARIGFDAAKMQVAQGVMKQQEHINTMLTGQAGRSDVTTDAAGNQIIIDKATGIAMPVTMGAPMGAPAVAGAPTAVGEPVKAKLSPEAEKTAVKNKETQKNLEEATTILEGLIKPGSLLDQATGSYLGSWADTLAGSVGYPLEGAKAAKSLKILADPILKMVPRFEGPQSDKDTQSYKEAAGQIADETLPAEVRRSAAKTMLMLMNRRRGQFVSADELANVQSGGTVSTAPSGGGFTPPPGWSHTVK